MADSGAAPDSLPPPQALSAEAATRAISEVIMRSLAAPAATSPMAAEASIEDEEDGDLGEIERRYMRMNVGSIPSSHVKPGTVTSAPQRARAASLRVAEAAGEWAAAP